MKKDIHPEYKNVIFRDITCDFELLIPSSIKTKETGKWKDGKEYPLCRMEISSASHPFYTGTDKIVDSEGRVEKFNRRFKLKQ